MTDAYAQSENRRHRIRFEKLRSVELFIDEFNRIYQFKLWGNALTSMFVLVKEGSEILDLLNVGEIFSMNYSGQENGQPAETLETRIKYINKVDQGRFKGHYITGLALMQSPP